MLILKKKKNPDCIRLFPIIGEKPHEHYDSSSQVLLHFQYAYSSVSLWMALFNYVPAEMISSSKYQVLGDQPKCKSSLQLKSNRTKSKMVAIRYLH